MRHVAATLDAWGVPHNMITAVLLAEVPQVSIVLSFLMVLVRRPCRCRGYGDCAHLVFRCGCAQAKQGLDNAHLFHLATSAAYGLSTADAARIIAPDKDENVLARLRRLRGAATNSRCSCRGAHALVSALGSHYHRCGPPVCVLGRKRH